MHLSPEQRNQLRAALYIPPTRCSGRIKIWCGKDGFRIPRSPAENGGTRLHKIVSDPHSPLDFHLSTSRWASPLRSNYPTTVDVYYSPSLVCTFFAARFLATFGNQRYFLGYLLEHFITGWQGQSFQQPSKHPLPPNLHNCHIMCPKYS